MSGFVRAGVALMTRSRLSCLSQLFGYACLAVLFIGQAAKPVMGVLAPSASLTASLSPDVILIDTLRLIGLLLYFGIVQRLRCPSRNGPAVAGSAAFTSVSRFPDCSCPLAASSLWQR